MTVFVVMACTFLNIRQRHQLTRLQAIESALIHHSNGGLKSLSTLGLKKCWLQYLLVNGSIMGLMSDIERYSDLWRISLTVYFSSFISLQCYVAYIAFFMQTAYIASKFLFFFGLLELEIFQFFLIHICAKVASTSSAIERENQKLGLLFSRFYLSKGAVNLRGLLKVS